MKKAAVAAVCLSVLGQAGVATADSIRQAADRAAREEPALEVSAGLLELQQSSGTRRRSVGRTVGGIILMGVGAPLLIVGLASEDAGGSICVGGDCITVDVDTGGAGYGVAALGGTVVVSGALLATIWSDVPVVNNLDFTVSPHRVQVGKTFGF